MSITISHRRLDPAEAELIVTGPGPISGRLVGPRCRYASTIEVAYHLRPIGEGMARVVIPEPSFWDPETPMLYEAVVAAGDETVRVKHGLRTVSLTSAGLRINRRPFRVNGVARTALNDAAALRASGVDTILCPVSAATASVWAEADELGFFVIGIVERDPSSLAMARELKTRPSCLGWILEAEDVLQPELLQTVVGREPLLGMRAETAGGNVPAWVQFLAGQALPWMSFDADVSGVMGQCTPHAPRED